MRGNWHIRNLCNCCFPRASSSSSSSSRARVTVSENTGSNNLQQQSSSSSSKSPRFLVKNPAIRRAQQFWKMAATKSGIKMLLTGTRSPNSPGVLFELPMELFNEIMSYLNRSDLAKLSSCCRASRNLLSRDVFGHLPESLTLDKKEGVLKPFPGLSSLRHLHSYFSYVVLKPPISYDYTNVTSPLQLTKIYEYVETIKYFPNIDRLWICWELPADCKDTDADAYREALINGILERLVTYDFWPKLNLFGLERYKSITGSEFRHKEQISVSWHFGGIRVFRQPKELVRGAPERYIKASSCTEEGHGGGCSCFAPGFQTTYMEVKRFGFGEAAAVGGRWGMGREDVVLLNTLDVHTDTFVGTPFEEEDEEGEAVIGGGSESEVEDEDDTSSSSEEDVDSESSDDENEGGEGSANNENTPTVPPEPIFKSGLIYPFVKKLVMSVKTGVTRQNIAELAWRCPNVSHLRIDGELLTEWSIQNGGNSHAYQQDEVIYSELMGFKSLETAVIPWPSIGGGSSSDKTGVATDFKQAEESITTWGEVGGLRLLRYVSFVNNCKKYPSSHWSRTYGISWEEGGKRCTVGYVSECLNDESAGYADP
ncbi:hypothetical protein TWF102_000910 [Orbilia oligospora]|uniref:F-box domain-containing protein n=1 Tax=Orbilia oligospora TaxID=2813651 RepID=A0A7C8NTJ2_ORBOL|nr:hypothetical protein TWF102_000910 [Orbilia oligospora]KAF3117413.1 hypothetical protein TWF103_006159 [Orbilia oligospora]